MAVTEIDSATLVQLAENRDNRARDQMFAALYEDLRRMAARQVRRSSVTLSPTTLLHETFLSMSLRRFAPFSDRSRFMAYASRAMRGLVIDYRRRTNAQKRGGNFEITTLPDEPLQVSNGATIEVERLREALDALASIEPRLAECVDLKFFCGFSFVDIARLWGISERTVHREWDKARLLLDDLISGTESSDA